MHKNTNKQGEKILLSGVAAAALGLINAKPQAVKAATLNGNRATKKTTRRTVKTKLNYQTLYSKTAETTEGIKASDYSQKNDVTDSNGKSSSNTSQNVDTEQSSISNTDNSQNTATTSNENNDPNALSSMSDSKVTTKDKNIKTTDSKKVTRSADLYHGLIYGKIPFTYNTTGILTITPNSNELIGTDYERTLSLRNACTLTDPGSPQYPGYNPTLDIKKIVIAGDLTGNIYVRGLFSGFKNLESIVGLSHIDFSNTVDMQSLFQDDPKLETIDGLNTMNTSKVTNMSGMFQGCNNLGSSENENKKDHFNIDISNFDFSNVVSLNSMFNDCTNLTSLTLPEKINTSKTTNMGGMFFACSSLKQLDLSKFDTSNVLSMKMMFKGCQALNYLNISSFDTSKLDETHISGMLQNLPSLNTLVLGKNCILKSGRLDVGLGTDGTWVNVGNGTIEKPEASKKWSSLDLIKNYNGANDADTYIRYTGGLVTVHYQDQEGNPVLDTTNKPVPVDYLAGNVGQSIPVDTNKKFPGYQIVKNQSFGAFTNKPQDVYVIYNAVLGHVKVQYRDENNNPLLDKDGKKIEATFLQGKIGQDKWNIDPNDYKLPGYAFVKADGKTSGIFDGTNPTVTLVYTDQGKVTIHYQDENGKPLLDKNGKEIKDSFLQGKIDQDKWNIDPNDYKLPGYAFVKADGKTSGIFDGTNPTVTLVYTDQGKVTIHYQDENNNPLLDKDGKKIEDTILQGKIGQDKWNIDTTDKKFQFYGYRFVEAQGKTSGVFDNSEPVITLKYTSIAQPIKVHYVDNQGKSISEDTILQGKVDKEITVSPKEISGYSVSEINGKKITDKGNITLYFSDKLQEITYTYVKNSSNTPTNNIPDKVKASDVIVHYQDEYGNTLAPNVVLGGYVGDGYVSEAKSIAGYTLKNRPNNATGFFTTFPQDVTYIYSKNKISDNQITNKQPNNIKQPKVPTSKKPKSKPVNRSKNINKTKQLNKKTNYPSGPTQRNITDLKASNKSTLPQTGKNQHSGLAMLTLGGIALLSALSLAWLDRKKE